MSDEFTKQDLFILMESYKNNIQLNTTILEQQKQILILNDQFIEKQRDLCDSVDQLINRLNDCSKTLAENHAVLTGSINSMSSKLSTSLESMSKDIKMESTNACSRLTVDHSNLKNQIYVAMGGMVLIILSLVGLFSSFMNKFDSLATLLKHVMPPS